MLSLLGVLLALFGSTFLLPLAAGLLLSEPSEQVAWLYGLPLLLSVGGGLLLYLRFRSEEELRDREAFALVSAAWLVFAVFGAIPYVMAGDMAGSDGAPLLVYEPTLAEAYFESISGLTTTGATVFDASVANGTTADGYYNAPKSLLLWRSQSQWLGGMGIIVLATVVLSRLLGGGIQVLRAEMPGTGVTRVKPQMAQTARLLWGLYAGLTVAEVLLLRFVGGLPLYDAVCTAFSTVATGGFSPQAGSIGAYNSGLVEGIVAVFMLTAGINFVLLYGFFSSVRRNREQRLLHGLRQLWTSGEFRYYLSFVAIAITLVVIGLWAPMQGGGRAPAEALRPALFQVVSLLTGTGFTTQDFGSWAPAAQFVLLLLMFVGGCAGSTAGGLKVIRIEILLKALWRELFLVIHPRAVRKLRLGAKVLDETLVRNVAVFFFIYIILFLTGALVLLYLEPGWTLVDAMGASIACLSNVGPGLGAVGPGASYAGLASPTLGVLSLLMWLGRLEIITGLLLFFPGTYRD
uniref:Trk system potassium uptake protein (TrkH) n=1 Tax=uncultured marine group II/III euryarchaeote KM3_176_D09 TaxID=1457935 RepID=A0A075GLE1_9EURY|nr:trk system potassium uptake protein (trkH) [uncultured marine group II/III euryarchaeote KM3_176_D09]